MYEAFNPSWINVMGGSMMQWINKYAPGFMCASSKPHPFVNERHNIFCGSTYILWRVQIVEGKYSPGPLGQN